MYAQNIQIGDRCFDNRSKKYLYPVLKYYGRDFIINFARLTKIAIGIQDKIVEICNLQEVFEGNLLFIIFNCKESFFPSFLSWFKLQSCYVYDYSFDNLLFGQYHMIVIQFPEKYSLSYDKFVTGNYSQMFSEKDIDNFYGDNDIKSVLRKDNDYKKIFKQKVQEDFMCPTLYIPDYLCEELDLPIAKNQEIFNYYLN